ncbi:hypothetical protein XA68_12799 [Ophiocordyceps unilateralis]|uniref:Uncharacterized protein n=1 Tax=Ophiocordyceps unilateralis TaxID=268505 RepID=A0A2A9PCT2_OPHUN|nr:hypothetical protein XA68_12799 [Ophiocordyceps unilateralis]
MKSSPLWTMLILSTSGTVQALPTSTSPKPASSSYQSLSTEGMVFLFDTLTSRLPKSPEAETSTLTPIELSSKRIRPMAANIDLVCLEDKASLEGLESVLGKKISRLSHRPQSQASSSGSKKLSGQDVNSRVLKSCLKKQNGQYIPDNFDVYCAEREALHLAEARQQPKEAVLDEILSQRFNSTATAIVKGRYTAL